MNATLIVLTLHIPFESISGGLCCAIMFEFVEEVFVTIPIKLFIVL